MNGPQSEGCSSVSAVGVDDGVDGYGGGYGGCGRRLPGAEVRLVGVLVAVAQRVDTARDVVLTDLRADLSGRLHSPPVEVVAVEGVVAGGVDPGLAVDDASSISGWDEGIGTGRTHK